MKKVILATSLIAASVSAFAWGAREQGALTGLVIGGIVGSQMEQSDRQYERQHEPRYRHQAPVHVQPQPVYIQPQPQICGYTVYCGPTSCSNEPMYNQWNQIVGYRQVCR